MESVWVVGHNIISPLGKTTKENFEKVQSGVTGVSSTQVGKNKVCAARISDRDNYAIGKGYGLFESLLIQSIDASLSDLAISADDSDTIFIISSTKGEIDSLEGSGKDVNLFESSLKVSTYFGNPNNPIVISNACISGSLAILMAKRLINSGLYKNAVVSGCDLISDFVTSGFNCLQAISSEPCRPFDADRNGINLGEAAATLIISEKENRIPVCIAGGATSNDANHISGPSRTGEELAIAIRKTFQESQLQPDQIGFVNAHGTATLFNDEMEANAFHLAGLNEVPLNSLKGYYGHTLGAAGCIESVLSVESLLSNELTVSLGFEKSGVSKPVNVIKSKETKDLKYFLKTASGFGGCNAVLAFEKLN